MKTLILTSCLDLYHRDENRNRIPHSITNDNGIVDILKSKIKKFDNFLFVASVENNPQATDIYAKVTFESFSMTIPFKNYNVLDIRTEDNAKELIKNADFIFLCGGHVPTQNQFFKNIKLKDLIKETNAVVCGGSAGSMNCANVVYCPPELEGESLDKNFKRYFSGLNLTNLNIMPHYDTRFYEVLDGKQYWNEIVLPDSYKTKMLVLNDGSFVVEENKIQTLYGEAYIFEKGKIIKICEDNKKINLDDIYKGVDNAKQN